MSAIRKLRALQSGKPLEDGRVSNYEKAKVLTQQRFAAYDPDEIIRRRQVEHDGQYLYLTFFHRRYRIRKADGYMEWSLDDFQTVTEAEFNDAMTVYDYLGDSKADACISGTFVTMEQLNRVQGGTQERTLAKGFFTPYTEHFDGHVPETAAACEKLGGIRKDKGGDVSYQFFMLPGFPFWFQFYESDDEFPAAATFLFDRNACSYLHFETLWYAVCSFLDMVTSCMEEMKTAEP